MIAVEKIPLLLLLLVVAAAVAQDHSLRHSRHYSHFNKIHEKIDKLDGLVLRYDDGEEPADKELPSSTTKDDLKGEQDYEDYSDEDEYEFEDDQTKVPDVVDPIRSHRHESDNDTVSSQEDSEFESDDIQALDSQQADEFNWLYYGTRENIETNSKTVTRSRRVEVNAALQHNMLITKEGSCKIPQRRVVPIQEIYPNPSKTYVPHCTFLHRCGDDTGCCQMESLTCMPKRLKQVELYFHTTLVGRTRPIVEKLSFINHTECECVPKRGNIMVKDETSHSLLRSGPTFHDIINIPEPETEAPIPLKTCRCPREFYVRILGDGECECDCMNRHRSCMNFKKGREHFSLSDRQCIQSGPCEKPNCEFGEYVVKIGRCPKRSEKIPENIAAIGNA